MKKRMYYHYSALVTLPQIDASGYLRPSNAGGAADETPLLWFSKNQRWEPTATKLVMTSSGPVKLTLAEQLEQFGCIRFGLPFDDPRMMDWRKACKVASISTAERKSLETVGKQDGALPSDWFAVKEIIYLNEVSFEVYHQNKWILTDPVSLAEGGISL